MTAAPSWRSGGRERLGLAAVWDAPRAGRVRSLRIWVLAFGLLLLVADAALTPRVRPVFQVLAWWPPALTFRSRSPEVWPKLPSFGLFFRTLAQEIL